MCPKIFFNQNLAMFQQSCQQGFFLVFWFIAGFGFSGSARGSEIRL